MSEKISHNIDVIEKEIDKISKLTNFKKIMTKHNSIKKKIKAVNDKVSKIEEELNTITINNNNDNSECKHSITTEDDFNVNLNMLKTLKHKFEECEDLEEQMHIYKLALEHITCCRGYLESQKIDIIEEK